MSRIRTAWRQYRAHRELARAIATQRRCCFGRCTTADAARLAQLGTVHIPRQIRREF